MDSPNRYKSTISFVDLLFNVLLGFVFLFIIAFILINPIAKRANVDMPASYMIILSWPNDSNDDIDLWVMDPNGNRVGFNRRESGLMNLDRDDIGTISDSVVIDGKSVIVELNREVVSLRGNVPGTYYVTAHVYTKRDDNPVPVTVEVIRVSPYDIVYKQEKLFVHFGESKNFYQFSITEGGEYYNIGSTGQSAME